LNTTIKVIIADDHPMFRSGLKNVLSTDTSIEIIGEAATGDMAITECFQKHPDLVIMDINMPIVDGIEATKQIKSVNQDIKVIILTMYSDEAYLREGLKVGASGYVLKKAVDMELISAIHSVWQGEKYIYPTLIPTLFHQTKNENQQEGNLNSLSKREQEVLKYIALGYTHQEIADTLFISVKTVDTYKSRIMEKLNVSKRSELVRFALKHDLLSSI
jgi:DNA-binding NarL/FixJ family response regulator